MNLFTTQINNMDDWEKAFQSIPAFAPLVEHIFQRENLPMATIEQMKPGTNAVFKVGDYVIKIFIPPGLNEDGFGTDVNVEIFGMRWANAQGVPSPKLIAEGVVADKYCFHYIVMEYIHGVSLDDIEDNLRYEDKVLIGQNIRKITDKLNRQCGNFTPIDAIQYAISLNNWAEEGFPASLLEERLAYLNGLHIREDDKVYCHADLHCENVLVDEQMNVYLIDFADAMYAPAGYEEVYVASALFCFERAYMEGYYGEYATADLVDLCMTWLPVHAWGWATIQGNLKTVQDITSFDVMRQRLYSFIENEKQKP